METELRLYSVLTWSEYSGAFTPQRGLGKWSNMTLRELKAYLRKLRKCGYSAHRRGNKHKGHKDNDASILIQRTDGMPALEWARSAR